MKELPLRKTAFNHLHHELGAKMAPFAGWEMPIQYPTGIFAEHRAVRTAAGLFDVSHMSAFEISGAPAPAFLETLLTNCVSRLDPGQAQYSCMLCPDGTTIDDIYLYRLEPDKFLIVSNAVNAERVKDWIQAVNSDGPVEFRDLRRAGEDSLVGVALQGPVSLDVLKKLADKQADRTILEGLTKNTIAHARLAGSSALIGRTGYTGEKIGFEIYIHPHNAEKFWGAVLDEGRELGVVPAGLGARDSTRTEAGLPLFGHEIEGELGASIAEAGYGFVLQFHAPFFIGRNPCLKRVQRSRRHILRLRGQGRKSIRPGHVIVDGSDKKAGTVTSFAYVDEEMTFIALALADEDFQPEPGETVKGVRTPADKFTGALEDRSVVELTVLTRFPSE